MSSPRWKKTWAALDRIRKWGWDVWRAGIVMPLALCAVLTLSALCVIGWFYDTSPEPLELAVSRLCSSDAGSTVVMITLPDNTVVVNPHGDRYNPWSSRSIPGEMPSFWGTCSAVQICTPRGEMWVGEGEITDGHGPYKPEYETPSRMCWDFMTKGSTLPEKLYFTASKQDFIAIDAPDLYAFQWRPERRFDARTGFSRWAVNVLVTPFKLARDPAMQASIDNDVQIVAVLNSGRNIVTAVPPPTRTWRESKSYLPPNSREEYEVIGFADTRTPEESQTHGLYLIYESDKLAAAREFLLFLLAALLGAVLPLIVEAWKRFSRSPRA